ncbi:hypothetical protein ACH5RR_032815 [Cinchona calisaya]|uniref:Uncharacterized protein n=1 Tax=Cinchona calisaya TaxID=153742 RepID=A0ABD2YJ69_9GENT
MELDKTLRLRIQLLILERKKKSHGWTLISGQSLISSGKILPNKSSVKTPTHFISLCFFLPSTLIFCHKFERVRVEKKRSMESRKRRGRELEEDESQGFLQFRKEYTVESSIWF